VDSSDDPDVEVLEQATRPEKLVEQIEASEGLSEEGTLNKRTSTTTSE
jgi:hypothetical protein